MGIVEVEPAPCQHLHSANYDPAKVVQGELIQILADGRLWCFDCEQFFTPQVPPRRYTLGQIKALAWEWCDEFDGNEYARITISTLIAWLARREREGRDGT